MEIIKALARPGTCFWDVGAHHGYVTVLASRCVGTTGVVYAFEPSPYNLAFLRAHIAWNRRANVQVVPMALTDREGMARFTERGSSQTFRLGTGGRTVEVSSLPTLLDQGFRPPDVLKLDVEGSEGAILAACAHRLPQQCCVLVSIHSLSNYDTVSTALRDRGFTLLESPGVVQLRQSTPGEWPDDPDLLAIGPGCRHLADLVQSLEYFCP